MLNVAVVMAGGSGSRFFPLSNSKKPKQLLKLENEKSMLRNTVDRVAEVVGIENVFISTRKDILENVKLDLGDLILNDHYIVEPYGKNTAPCIALSLGAVSAVCKTEELCIGFFPSDHVIKMNFYSSQNEFKIAYNFARNANGLVAIGVEPKSPHTGYGYIECLFEQVIRFTEKPDVETAKKYMAGGTGNCLWNTGMYFGCYHQWLEAFEAHCPDLVCLIYLVSKNYDYERLNKLIDCVWEHINPCSIDKAIMEKHGKMSVLRVDFEWNDLGTWDSLASRNTSDGNGNIVLGDNKDIYKIDSFYCTLGNYDSDIKIGLIGVQDLIVVVHNGNVLVCAKDREQDIGKIAKLMGD